MSKPKRRLSKVIAEAVRSGLCEHHLRMESYGNEVRISGTMGSVSHRTPPMSGFGDGPDMGVADAFVSALLASEHALCVDFWWTIAIVLERVATNPHVPKPDADFRMKNRRLMTLLRAIKAEFEAELCEIEAEEEEKSNPVSTGP